MSTAPCGTLHHGETLPDYALQSTVATQPPSIPAVCGARAVACSSRADVNRHTPPLVTKYARLTRSFALDSRLKVLRPPKHLEPAHARLMRGRRD